MSEKYVIPGKSPMDQTKGFFGKDPENIHDFFVLSEDYHDAITSVIRNSERVGLTFPDGDYELFAGNESGRSVKWAADFYEEVKNDAEEVFEIISFDEPDIGEEVIDYELRSLYTYDSGENPVYQRLISNGRVSEFGQLEDPENDETMVNHGDHPMNKLGDKKKWYGATVSLSNRWEKYAEIMDSLKD